MAIRNDLSLLEQLTLAKGDRDSFQEESGRRGLRIAAIEGDLAMERAESAELRNKLLAMDAELAALCAKLTATEAERDAANRRIQTCFDRYRKLWNAGVAFTNTEGEFASAEEVEAYRKLLHELMASELWSEDRLNNG